MRAIKQFVVVAVAALACAAAAAPVAAEPAAGEDLALKLRRALPCTLSSIPDAVPLRAVVTSVSMSC